MNVNDVLDMIGDAKGTYVWDAQIIRSGATGTEVRKLPAKNVSDRCNCNFAACVGRLCGDLHAAYAGFEDRRTYRNIHAAKFERDHGERIGCSFLAGYSGFLQLSRKSGMAGVYAVI